MAEERMLITGGQRLEEPCASAAAKNTSVAVISASILSGNALRDRKSAEHRGTSTFRWRRCAIWARRSTRIPTRA